ncbi:hypothetical protein HanIR_Chr16g0815811 [Helianthus annuus]|nr:hypothetical protein HanIR_Chr16g0815811 [Helianthus annuus]
MFLAPTTTATHCHAMPGQLPWFLWIFMWILFPILLWSSWAYFNKWGVQWKVNYRPVFL